MSEAGASVEDKGLAPRSGGTSAGPRVAVVSLFFIRPSTGGGNVHTAELVTFLARWIRRRAFPFRTRTMGHWPGLRDSARRPYRVLLRYKATDWTGGAIQSRLHDRLVDFRSDHVIVTHCWNFKPLLGEAVQDYPYILRQQALECLCPLDNLRFLVDAGSEPVQFPLHQMATPHLCLG